jgi:hypothetical protein
MAAGILTNDNFVFAILFFLLGSWVRDVKRQGNNCILVVRRHLSN